MNGNNDFDAAIYEWLDVNDEQLLKNSATP